MSDFVLPIDKSTLSAMTSFVTGDVEVISFEGIPIEEDAESMNLVLQRPATTDEDNIHIPPLSMYSTQDIVDELKKRYPLGIVMAYTTDDHSEFSDKIREEFADQKFLNNMSYTGHIGVCQFLVESVLAPGLNMGYYNYDEGDDEE